MVCNLRSSLESKDEVARSLELENSRLREEMNSVAAEYGIRGNRLLALQNEIAVLQGVLEEKLAALVEKEQQIDGANTMIANLQVLLDDKASVSDELQELEIQIQNLQEDYSDKCREVEIKNHDLEAKNEEIQRIRNSLASSIENAVLFGDVWNIFLKFRDAVSWDMWICIYFVFEFYLHISKWLM